MDTRENYLFRAFLQKHSIGRGSGRSAGKRHLFKLAVARPALRQPPLLAHVRVILALAAKPLAIVSPENISSSTTLHLRFTSVHLCLDRANSTLRFFSTNVGPAFEIKMATMSFSSRLFRREDPDHELEMCTYFQPSCPRGFFARIPIFPAKDRCKSTRSILFSVPEVEVYLQYLLIINI